MYTLLEVYKQAAVRLREGASDKFLASLTDPYNPYIGNSDHPFINHKDDKYQYTILNGRKPVGYITVPDKNQNMAFVLSPEYRGKGYGPQAVEQLMNKTESDRLEWNVKPSNYPSLKALYGMGGGIQPMSLWERIFGADDYYEGEVRKDKSMDKDKRKALEKAIADAARNERWAR